MCFSLQLLPLQEALAGKSAPIVIHQQPMSEQEYLVLDELYFLQSFDELQELTGLSPDALKSVLSDLVGKGWVKCTKSREGEEPVGTEEFLSGYLQFHYLATKAGLLAHNSR
jgi:DNA-binding MarR family transcriptional regulator